MDDIHFSEIINIIKSRKGIIGVIFLISMAWTAFYLIKRVPVYQATTKVLIESKTPKGIPSEEIFVKDYRENQFLITQYSLFESRSLIKKLIQELNLIDNKELKNSLSFINISPLKNWIKSLLADLGFFRQGRKGGANLDPYTPLIDEFLKRLHVDPLEKSRILSIHYEGFSPDLSAQIVNTLVDIHIREQMEYQYALGEDAKNWLNLEADKLTKRYEDSQTKMQDFVENAKLVDLDDKREFTNQKYRETLTEIARLKAKKLKLKTLVQQLKKTELSPEKLLDAIPSSLTNETISHLRTAYLEEKIEYDKLTKTVKPTHPELIASSARIKSIEARIPKELSGFRNSLESDYKASEQQEEELKELIKNQNTEIMELDKNILQFNQLKRESKSINELLFQIKNRGKELDVILSFSLPPIRIVDRAEVPAKPIKPRMGLSLTLGLGFGVFGGFLLAFLREMTDDTLKNENDVERQLPFYLLGSIGWNKENGDFKSAAKKYPVWAEEYRYLGNKLLSLMSKRSLKIVMVTSATPGEGKTTVVSKLAYSLGQAGKKAVIVETDYKNPKIYKIFGVDKNEGLISQSDGKINFGINPIKTEYQGVWVIPAGEEPKGNPISPDEIFSRNFKHYLRKLKKDFDIVLVKAPPSLSLSHANFIEKFCEGIIFLIASGISDRKTIEKAIGQLVSSSVEMKNGQYLQGGGQIDSPTGNEKTNKKLFRILITKVKNKEECIFPYPYPMKNL